MTLDEIASIVLGTAHEGKSPEVIAKLAHRLAKAICKDHGHHGVLRGGNLWFCVRCRTEYFVLQGPLRKTKRKKRGRK